MHDLIAFLKDVVSRSPGSGVTGCYIVRNGSIYARNMMLQAGVAMESTVPFNIPADALDMALGRMKEVQSLTVDDNTVTIKAGRLRSTIKCNPDTPPDMPDMPKKWLPCPAGLTDALVVAVPFLGERVWSTCVRLMNNRVTAVSNAAGVDVEVAGLKLAAPVLITKETAAFLIAQGAPDHYAADTNGITFKWEDGRWARAQFYNDQMPANVDTIFDNAVGKMPVAITEDWKEAYTDLAAMVDGTITITPEGMQGNKGDAVTDVEVPMKLPKGHSSRWAVKVLGPMVACATAWNPTLYPDKPCPFVGPGLRGVVVGVSS